MSRRCATPGVVAEEVFHASKSSQRGTLLLVRLTR